MLSINVFGYLVMLARGNEYPKLVCCTFATLTTCHASFSCHIKNSWANVEESLKILFTQEICVWNKQSSEESSRKL